MCAAHSCRYHELGWSDEQRESNSELVKCIPQVGMAMCTAISTVYRIRPYYIILYYNNLMQSYGTRVYCHVVVAIVDDSK